MCEGRDCRHGPSRQRKPYNLKLDPFGFKRRLRETNISYRDIAHRAGVRSVAFVSDVRGGRKCSWYVEIAARDLLDERG